MAESNLNQTFLKIESFGKKTYAMTLLLRYDDIIVAIDNNLYQKGENAFVDDLNIAKKNKTDVILTISRNDTFFDILVSGSLGCKFTSTSSEETKTIVEKFAQKENFDKEQLNSYTVMRDIKNNYEIINMSKSLAAGIFPPLWLAFHQKWWLLALFSVMSFLIISVNTLLFIFAWICLSLYCYIGQIELLTSFAMLSGKVFSMRLASINIENSQKLIRKLYPKSKFKYSKLGDPVVEEEDKNSKNTSKENKISTSQEALV